MKKHLFNLTIIVCAIYVSSCSMMKRHYVNGYYVSHYATPATNTTQAQVTETIPALYALQPIRNNAADKPEPILVTENGLAAENNKQPLHKTTLAATRTKHPVHNALNINAVKENQKSLNAKKPKSDEIIVDALSLFWIVVLVLLILWLIAILTGGWGLGLFVHAILLVALILLILWLLRVI